MWLVGLTLRLIRRKVGSLRTIMAGLTQNQLIAEASRWEKYAKKLREAADLLDGKPAEDRPAKVRHSAPPAATPSGTREAQLQKFLEHHGPTTRSVLVKQTEIPLGSIKGVLRKSKLFERDKQGRWKVKASAPASGSGTAKTPEH